MYKKEIKMDKKEIKKCIKMDKKEIKRKRMKNIGRRASPIGGWYDTRQYRGCLWFLIFRLLPEENHPKNNKIIINPIQKPRMEVS